MTEGRGRTLLRMLGLSTLVLVPVWWMPRVVSSDLTSHTSNAWLALQVDRGVLPGLEVVRQYTNVLVDLVLAFLLRHVDAALAERVAVSGMVLLFFGAGWSFVRAVRGRVDPGSAALLVAATHGWVLQQGLLNYYVAVACSLWFLALAWGNGMRGVALGVPFLLVAATGNPLPPLWAASVLAFVAIARHVSAARAWLLLPAAAVAVRVALAVPRWPVEFWWRGDQAVYATGADQLILFSSWSVVPAMLVLLAQFGLQAASDVRSDGMAATAARPEFQALVASMLCVVVLPAGFRIPAHDSLVSLIPQRQSLVVLVVAIATFGPSGFRPARVTAIAIALAWFALLYQGHRRVIAMEREVARLVSAVPDGARVIGGAQYRNTRVGYYQLVERACQGRCYSFGNYEPSSGQFRVRATGPNPVVMADVRSVRDLHLGHYIVRPGDLPAWGLESCPAGTNRYCLHPLAAGDTVGDGAPADLRGR